METTTAELLHHSDTGKQVAFVDTDGRYVQGPVTDVATSTSSERIWIELAGRTFEVTRDTKIEIA